MAKFRFGQQDISSFLNNSSIVFCSLLASQNLDISQVKIGSRLEFYCNSYSPFSYLLTFFKNKLRLKGEKSLSAEMEIVFTELLLLGGMKQAMRNTRRSGGGLAVCFRKIQRFLSSDSSLFSTTKTVTVSRTPKFSTVVSSADLTKYSWQTVTAQFLSMLRLEANASHEIAFRPLVDLLFPKMNGPLLASVPKKTYSRNGNCASLWSSRVI